MKEKTKKYRRKLTKVCFIFVILSALNLAAAIPLIAMGAMETTGLIYDGVIFVACLGEWLWERSKDIKTEKQQNAEAAPKAK